MQQSTEHANRAIHNGDLKAYYFFITYAAAHPDGFLTEDVVDAANDFVNLAAPDDRAWGSIAKLANSNGRVINAGFAYSRKGNGNAAPRTVWKVKS
jgi:hypothetical protein